VVRRGIVRDICPEGPEHLSTARRILLDRLMSKLAWARLAEEYLAAFGLLKPDKLKEKTLEAHPLMAFWLSVNNQITRDLAILGLDRKALEVVDLTPMELLAAAAEDAATESEDAPCRVQDGPGNASAGRPEAGEGSGQGEEDVEP